MLYDHRDDHAKLTSTVVRDVVLFHKLTDGEKTGLVRRRLPPPLLGRHVRRWGRLALPLVLVALGLLILARAMVLVRG
ncbi:hypothetical protein [Polyangium aurulentum]|uniref:hypothetical protein n=1 Tax=Polyangium aurulentum TaxID=2567896 RepID=UPI0010AEE2F3|nr:hypothetical protein [Polyangium aurulentum]UQA63214.1 hypothetical protein E8A73_023225 [Polyangium aurulentum]